MGIGLKFGYTVKTKGPSEKQTHCVYYLYTTDIPKPQKLYYIYNLLKWTTFQNGLILYCSQTFLRGFTVYTYTVPL